jgi:hypothetical protein
MTARDDSRDRPIDVRWSGQIGHLEINGELWALVEWSEKRQDWCIEDAEGRCLKHASDLRGSAPDKAAAIALATAMIRDGRMPSPEDARQRRRAEREKRALQPAQQRRQQERLKRDLLSRALLDAERKERAEPPLYEMLADVFDFADPDLWKSNSFAALRPRLTTHVRAVIAKLEYNLADTTARASKQRFSMWDAQRCRQIQAKLDRACEILALLDDPVGDAP